jgi:hypothetical protein
MRNRMLVLCMSSAISTLVGAMLFAEPSAQALPLTASAIHDAVSDTTWRTSVGTTRMAAPVLMFRLRVGMVAPSGPMRAGHIKLRDPDTIRRDPDTILGTGRIPKVPTDLQFSCRLILTPSACLP